MGFQVSVIIKRYSRFEKVCSFLYDLVIDNRLSDTVSEIGRNLCTLETAGDVESGIALNRYVYVRQYTLYLYYEGDFLLTLRFIAILRCVRRPKTSLP